MSPRLIADLIAAGVQFRPEEAVAIAQQLIHSAAASIGSASSTAPLGPPSPGTVHLHPDGSVTCDGYDVKPAVFEMAILLQTLLPAGARQVSGGLRYAIARGLHDVDAPPFDSIEEFSRGLERFEQGERRAIVRALLARATDRPDLQAFGRSRAELPAIDRRRTAPSTTALRRALREADLRLYELSRSAAASTEPPSGVVPPTIARPEPFAAPAPRSRARNWTRLAAAAAVLIFGVALADVADLLHFRTPQPAAAPTQTSEPVAAAAASNQQIPAPGPPAALPLAQSPRVVARTPHANAPSRLATAVAARGGSVVQALDAGHHPVFSPAFASNGAAMFFHTGGTRDARSALAVMPASHVAGGDLRVMTIVDDGARNFHVQPSPDGQFIAFDSDRDGDRGVYLANSDGTHVRRISGPGYAAVPTWAPDGRRIAYIRAEPANPKVWNLWLQSLDGTDARRLTSYRFGQPWSASWFSDNRRICYTHEDKVIVLDLDTRRTREFDSPVKGRLVRTPAVSPDGTKVIFQVFRKGAWMLDLTDGSMRRVLTDPTAEEFAWAPDGRRVAFHSRRDGQWGIYILHRG